MKQAINERFTIAGRFRSLGFALNGIRSIFKTEHNMWVHLVATITVIALAIFFRVSWLEGATLTIVIGMVWVAEIANTVIEKIMDFIFPRPHAAVKHIKDMSAAAVLVSSLIALVTGCIIFIPKMLI